MKKTIRVCDRCGKQLKDNDEINYMSDYKYIFEICSECYEIMKPIKEKRDKDYEKLVNKLNKIEADFNSEFKVFIGGDEE